MAATLSSQMFEASAAHIVVPTAAATVRLVYCTAAAAAAAAAAPPVLKFEIAVKALVLAIIGHAKRVLLSTTR